MAQANKIYQATEDFIESYRILKEQGKVPKHEELCKIMGVKSISVISGILNRRQNIQPEQWQKFKVHFGIAENPETTPTLKESNPPYKTESSKYTSDDESIYLSQIMKTLKKQGEALELIVLNLKDLATTQKKILEQLKPKAGKTGKK